MPGRIALVAGLVAVAAATAGSAAALVPAPAGGRSILSFPVRDFVSLGGYAQNSRVTVEVVRGDTVVGVAHDAIPQDDPKTVGVFDGLVDVNHPGGACWEGVTPNIRAGDVIRATQVDALGTSVTEQTVTQDVVITQPATNDPAGSLVVTVKGTAQDALGNPIPIAQLEQRMVSSSADRFAVNNKRTLRAPGEGTIAYDEPGSVHWTAIYRLPASDVARAVGSQSRIMWLGADPAAANEATIYEYGEVGGPTPPCTAPAEQVVASVAPSTLGFVAQDVGTQSAAKTVTVTNTGAGAASLLTIANAATDVADYAITADTCTGASLSPGASCNIDVAFAPTAAGSRPGMLSISDNAGGSPHTVSLAGNGVDAGSTAAPIVSVAPSSLTFAARVVGRPSLAKSLSVTNAGNAPLEITAVNATGGDFSVGGGTCATGLPVTVAVGDSCTVAVVFTPSATGLRTGSVDLSDSAADSPQQIALSGTGLSTAGVNDPPVLPHSIISFPARDFVSASGWDATDLVTVEIIRHGEVVGVSPNVVPQDDPGTPGVFDGIVEVNHPGGACWVDVTPDIRAGDVVRLTTDGGVSDQTTTANVVVTQAATAVGPGTVEIKGTARDANGDPIPLAQLAARIIGASADPFANGTRRLQTPNDGTLVYDAPGSVHWTATFPGLSAADVDRAVAAESRILWLGRDPLALNELTIYESGQINGPTPPCTAPAAAASPDAAVAPSTVVFPSVMVGTTSTAKQVTITNPGTAPLHVSSVTVTGPDAADFAVDAAACSVPVAPDASCTVNVTLAPSAEGPRTAALSIADDAIGSPHTAVLTGTGVAQPVPSVELTPASLHFPGGSIGAASDPMTVTVSNAGQADLIVTALDVSPAGSDFTVTGGTCSPLPVTVAAATSCTVDITFSPTAIGDRSATLSIATNAAGSPHTVALTGIALADGQVNDPPVAPHSVLVFPVRDFTSGSGYAPTDLVTVEVIRNGVVVGIARDVVPVDDPATPNVFDGLVDVNHPGGGCWAQNAQPGDPLVTPDIRPGDVVRYLTSTAPAVGDQTPTQHVVVTLPATDVNGTIVVKGIATDVRGGGRIPVAQLEARLIASSAAPFQANGRRLLRAPGDGSVSYDGPTTSHWTATFSGLSAADRALATASETRIMWRGRDPIALTEGTVYEFGQVGGPSAPCDAPAETPAPAASATVAPADVTFGAGALSIASTPTDVIVTNSGAVDLNVSGAVIAGPNASDFSAGTGCDGALLVAGASCTIATTFTPSAPGARTATLLVATDAGTTPHAVTLSGSGAAPAVSTSAVSPFGNEVVGTTSTGQTITVTNGGTAELDISAVAASGDFAATGCVGAALAPTETCDITVTFSPTATGARSGALTIRSNAPTDPDSVALSGTGVAVPAPVVSLTATSLAFGNQFVGTTSATQSVTLTNTGTADLNVASVAVTGAEAAAFSAVGCPAGVLAQGASCTVVVTFAPSTTGAKSATLDVTSDAATSGSDTVALSGTGVAPAASLSTTSLGFGEQVIGTTSGAPQTVTLTNTGTATLLFADSIGGANGADFSRTGGTCTTTLAPAASCTVDVAFTPSATGTRTATLTFTSNAASSPGTVALSGTGVPVPAPVVSLSPTSLFFGDQVLNTTSAAQTVTMTNTGNAPLTFTAAIAGTNPANFTRAGGSCATTLAASASCTFTVTFRPNALGARNALLRITSNAASSPDTVSLGGNGVTAAAPGLTVAPTSLDFGNQVLNTTSAAHMLTLTNTGNALLTFSTSIGGANPANFSQSGGTCVSPLAAGASCTMGVTFRPNALGTRTATLRIDNNAPTGRRNVSLAGVGVSTTDTTAPVSQAPARTLSQGVQLLSQTVPVTLRWSGIDIGTGIASFQLQQTTNGGATWVNVALPTATSTTIDRALAPGTTVYQFRVRATDVAGNVGAFAVGTPFRVTAVQDGTPSIVNSGVWSSQNGGGLFGGTTAFTQGPGSAVLSFRGDSVAWVASMGPGRGIGLVFIDGAQVATVDLFAPNLVNRRMVFTTPLAEGLHTIEVRSAHTRNIASSGFRVDVDAFIVTS